MCVSSHLFLVMLILLGSSKESESLCKNSFGYVTCESMYHISDRVISGIPDVREALVITIHSSPELEIFPNAFSSAVKMRRLHISNTKVLKLHNHSFRNSSLSQLLLTSNDVVSIDPDTFSNLPLKMLSLDSNNLEGVPRNLANSSLQSLRLSNNKIQYMKIDTLGNLSFLHYLTLDGNKLQSVFPHLFLTYPQILSSLYLQNNSLRGITNYMMHSLTGLTLLHLGSNSISFIEVNSFENSPKLEMLILSNNHLKVLEQDIFPRCGMNCLRVLYLDNNKLMFLSTGFFIQLTSLKEVTLVGNPWLCPCLTAVEKLLAESYVTESCLEDYTKGRKKTDLCKRHT